MANNLDAFIPEVWAQEALMRLEANMVAANLVYRDFSNEVARFGDVVNTRRPAAVEAFRKVKGDTIVSSDISATNVPITLNQHIIQSIVIDDEDASKSFQDLSNIYLSESLISVARIIDQIVIAQQYGFLSATQKVGMLQAGFTSTNAIAVNTMFDTANVPQNNRTCLITPAAKGSLLSVDSFTEADKIGDNGTALRTASLGQLFGTNFLMSQNAPSVPVAGQTVAATTTINAGNLTAGSTVITVAAATSMTAGMYLTVAGDMIPQLITAINTAALTISPGLSATIVTGAAVKAYAGSIIDVTTSYAANWAKVMALKTGTTIPVKGQLVTLGIIPDNKYGSVGTATLTNMLLDRPLAAAVLDDAVVGMAPPGDYNWCFHKNAVALITRPPVAAAPGVGTRSAVASYNGFGLRVEIGRDMRTQQTIINVDVLLGVKVLDTSLGFIAYS